MKMCYEMSVWVRRYEKLLVRKRCFARTII